MDEKERAVEQNIREFLLDSGADAVAAWVYEEVFGDPEDDDEVWELGWEINFGGHAIGENVTVWENLSNPKEVVQKQLEVVRQIHWALFRHAEVLEQFLSALEARE